jgi:Leucine-rich repeat (LRR) protein
MYRHLVVLLTLSCSVLAGYVSLRAQEATAASDVNSAAIQAIRGLAGVQIQEKDGRIIGIDFRKCSGAWGEVLPRVLEIPSLQSILVSGPQATHERIVSLASLPNLRSLRMEQCAITDATIAAVSRFPKIDDVGIDRCPITDQSMKSLSQVAAIKRIRVPRTELTDQGLSHLKDAIQLELLDLAECHQISDAGLTHLKGLTKLRNLTLSGPRITDAGMLHLPGLTNMVAISFHECAITDQSFGALSGMTKLREFDVFRTRVGGHALSWIAGAKEISKIKMRDSAITTQDIVEHIGKFPNLTALDLSETEIGDGALVEIGKLTKLEDLNLWRSQVTSSGVRFLVNLPLKRLNLDDTSVGDAAIPHVSQIRSLEFVHLGKTSVTDQGIEGLKELSKIKDLVLTNTGLSPEAVERLRSQLPETRIQF